MSNTVISGILLVIMVVIAIITVPRAIKKRREIIDAVTNSASKEDIQELKRQIAEFKNLQKK